MRRTLLFTFLLSLALALTGLPAAGAQSGGPATALAADAFGVEARLGLVGMDLGGVGPVPTVESRMPPQSADEVAEVAEVGPFPDDGALLEHVRGLKVRAGGDLAAGTAHATAETAAVSLFGGEITADALVASASSSCPDAGTPEEASEGTSFVNLSIGGQEIPATPPPNTRIRVANDSGGIIEVVIRETVPDEDAHGWTVRALHVFTLDPVTEAVNGEVIIGEAHAALVCEGETTGPGDEDRPALEISKDADHDTVAPGDTLTYTVDIANRSEMSCTVFEVIDRLPDGFTYLSAGGAFSDATATVEGRTVRLRNDEGWTIEAGEALSGDITVRVSSRLPAGTYFNDVELRSTCGTARTGPTAPVTVAPTEPAPRAGGVDRVETAIEVSREAFERADAAVLARSDDFPDALASSTLAVEVEGPILVTPPTQLREDVAAELGRLGVQRVYLSGGTAALSEAVEAEVRARGIEPVRLAGKNRFDTAYLVAEEVVRLGGPVDQAIVARADLFPDSLAAANLATHGRAPIFLTLTDGPLHGQAEDGIREFSRGDRVAIAGGTAAVGPQAEADLNGLGYTVRRVYGPERFATARAFTAEGVGVGANLDPTLLASGLDFTDALVAGPAAWKLGGTVMLTHPETLDKSPATRTYFTDHREAIDTVLIIGGTAAVSERVASEVSEIIR